MIKLLLRSLGSWLVLPRKTEHRSRKINRKINRTLRTGDQNTLCALKNPPLDRILAMEILVYYKCLNNKEIK